MNVHDLVTALPKAELHLHIEGTLEPEMLFEFAERNQVDLSYPDVEAVRRAYVFEDLQSFLDIYYAGCRVLHDERDFSELTSAYLRRAAADGVRHAEIFFDPQTHTGRGVPFRTVVDGIRAGLDAGERELSITSRLIMCFLRDESEASAMTTLDDAFAYGEGIDGVGLDSAEVGNPPRKFRRAFERARAAGLRAVAHAGEEGSPDYVWEALDVLRVDRVDHGVRCLGDDELVARLVAEQVPLTVCPLSNVKLRVFPSLEAHNLAELLRRGLRVTVSSDDPAYFGGYVAENYTATAGALGLEPAELVELARNSWKASFLDERTRRRRLDEIDAIAATA